MKKTAEKKVVEKKAVARRPAKAKDNLLLAREHKQVFKDGDSVLKVFDANYKVSAILNEAMNEARAAETGLPVAKILEVCVIKGKWAIRREFIEGETLADVMAKDKKNLTKYLKEFAQIQCAVFAKTSPRMGNLAD